MSSILSEHFVAGVMIFSQQQPSMPSMVQDSLQRKFFSDPQLTQTGLVASQNKGITGEPSITKWEI